MIDIFASAPLTGRRGGRPTRSKFGIVHYAKGTKQSFLVIPSAHGISIGDKITFYATEGGIGFRVGPSGTYSVFTPTVYGVSLRCTLCCELEAFAGHRVKDIVTKVVPGGWIVPLDQFE